jgi:NADH-quinone oxidoreductase subunit N
MNFGAFLAVIAVRERTGSEAIAAYRGLGATSPLVALCLAVFLFSLTGVPPFAGFLGKFYLFVSVLHTGQPFFALLAVVGALNSAVSLYYYARLLKVMYLEGAAAGAGPLPVARGARALLAALAVPTLVLGVYWAPLAELVAASGGLGR